MTKIASELLNAGVTDRNTSNANADTQGQINTTAAAKSKVREIGPVSRNVRQHCSRNKIPGIKIT
jgi:hypothetical protein